MARQPILGLFEDANYAAEAGDALQRANISPQDYDFLTDAPYPEGAFGERQEKHRLYVFPFVGALIGITVGILLTSMTQLAYPLTQGGKPILSLPPMAVVTYETTMLGAIIFTVLGILFESRLPKAKIAALRHPNHRRIHRRSGNYGRGTIVRGLRHIDPSRGRRRGA